MKKFIIYSIFLLLSSKSYAEIIEIDNFREISSKFLELKKDYEPSNILLVLGIRNVLIQPSSYALNIVDENSQALLKKVLTQQKREKSIFSSEIILTKYQHQLVDQAIPSIIKDISVTGTPIIAISSSLTGNLNNIDRLEVWVADYLKKFKLDFSGSFPKSNDIIFSDMKEFEGTYPCYYEGVLSTNKNYSKAQVLLNFLVKMQLTPQLIIIVDNEIGDLTLIEQQLNNFSKDIRFLGYHYTAANDAQFEEIGDQVFVDFWYSLIDKINKSKREKLPNNSTKDPYD